MSKRTEFLMQLIQEESSIFLDENRQYTADDRIKLDGLLFTISQLIMVELVKRDIIEEELTRRVIKYIMDHPAADVDPIYQ